jgi:hypothetical protein
MEKPGDVLKKLGMTGILTLPPEEGGISQLLCDTDECYCPRGRGYFDPISQDDQGAWVEWMPTEEHWPIGQAEGGLRVKANIWLAHRLCNFLAGLEQERRVRGPGSRNGRGPIPRSTSPSSATAKPLMPSGDSNPVAGRRIQIRPVLFPLIRRAHGIFPKSAAPYSNSKDRNGCHSSEGRSSSEGWGVPFRAPPSPNRASA